LATSTECVRSYETSTATDSDKYRGRFYVKKSASTKLRILVNVPLEINSTFECGMWQVLINGEPCSPTAIVAYSFSEGLNSVVRGLLLGMCGDIQKGGIKLDIERRQCNGSIQGLQNVHVSYTISEVNLGFTCPTDSIFNIVARNEQSTAMAGDIIFATFIYAKSENDTLIQIIMTTTISTTPLCYFLFLTFNGRECATPISGMTVFDDHTGNLTYHKPIALFGLCPDLPSGDILISLNIHECKTKAQINPRLLNIGYRAGIQFEASEIRLNYLPQSISKIKARGLPFNIKHFTFNTTNSQIIYNKSMPDTHLYIMAGSSIGGRY